MLNGQQKLFTVLLFVVVAIGSSTGFKRDQVVHQDENEREFTLFLDRKMTQYGRWLQDEKLDPSFPLPGTNSLSRKTTEYLLNCDIKNQVIQHHSETVGDVAITESSFIDHYAVLGREVHQAYELTGEYLCNGVLYAAFVGGLDKDLPFSGEGSFVVEVNSSVELVEVMNLGIKEDYTFDLAPSWTSYFFDPDLDKVLLTGDWDNNQVVELIFIVQAAFRSMYYDHLFQDSHSAVHTNPSRMLFQRFVRETLGDVKLADIVTDLPPYFEATPSTTTPTTPKYTGETSEETSPTEPGDQDGGGNGAASKLVNFGTAFWTALLVLLLGLLTPKV